MKHQKHLPEVNLTSLMEFFLLGFSDIPNLQMFLFGIFFFVYVIILMGNGIIILITRVDKTLQTPMYFFLANFSFLEICYVSTTIPKMLMNLWTQQRNISLFECATQMCFFLIFGGTECLLLAVMAYDRYVAISNPLHYPLVMKRRVCIQLVTCSWITGIPVPIGQMYQTYSLPFCGSNQINLFFCGMPQVFTLACGDTFPNEMSVYIVVVLFVTVPFLLILGSYGKIISTILKLPSATSRAKAFSTSSSHLIVVTLFFGSGFTTYFQPKSKHSSERDRFLSLFYTILVPVFNPMIHTLRNKDVMVALKKLLPQCFVTLATNFNFLCLFSFNFGVL